MARILFPKNHSERKRGHAFPGVFPFAHSTVSLRAFSKRIRPFGERETDREASSLLFLGDKNKLVVTRGDLDFDIFLFSFFLLLFFSGFCLDPCERDGGDENKGFVILVCGILLLEIGVVSSSLVSSSSSSEASDASSDSS